MPIEFRFATPDEIPEIGRLIDHCFPSAARTPGGWADELWRTDYGDGPEIVWVGEENGRIIAACQLHSLLEWVAGEPLPTLGLGTVAISPTHRKRGLASEMARTGLGAALARGDVASALYPFRASFYGKLGYGLAGQAEQYRIAPEALPSSSERSRVEIAESAAERADVREFYERWARTQTGQLVRGARLWSRLLEPPRRALMAYRDAEGMVEGYALVAYRTDLPGPERHLEVLETAWATDRARDGLDGWLASLGDQWRAILVRALPSHHFGDRLGGPRLLGGSTPGWGLWYPSATLLRGPMFRLLDLAGAWERRHVASDVTLTLALHVHDEQIPANSGSWQLALDGGRVTVGRGGGPADVSMRLGVDTLSRLFIGALSPSAAVRGGFAEVGAEEHLIQLDRALGLPDPWTFDHF